MTTHKKPTVAQLLRKIERLEAQLARHEAMSAFTAKNQLQDWRAAADAEVRIKQAIRILNGEDDA